MISNNDFNIVFKRLRWIWMVCFGSLALMVASCFVVNHIWIPYVAFIYMAIIIYMGNYNLSHSSINCSMMTHYTVYILLLSGLVMLTLNLFNTHLISSRYSQFSHSNSPFHVSLIIYPIATVLYGIALLRRGHPAYCKACKEQSGFSIDESLRRNAIHHESKLQLRLAFALSLLISLVVWGYYFAYYRRAGLAGPDKFFLYYVPLMIFAISVLYFLARYNNLQFEIHITDTALGASRQQLVRFMVVRGDEILLQESASSAEIGLSLWDTPAILSFDLPHEISEERAKHLFSNMSGAKDFSLKRLFMTNVGKQNVTHYAAFLAPESEVTLAGQWFNLYTIDNMLKNGLLARSFAYELHRIFTITMAWKTYTRDGKRLYPIKNYRPTFRLRDFHSWDVDYSDLEWISISENNEDKRLFKLRRFWREHISGIDRRWRRQNS